MKDKFKTKAGDLTPYALACGYLEQVEVNNVRVTLWQEGIFYHVRCHNFETHTRKSWETFAKLTDARRAFKVIVKGISK